MVSDRDPDELTQATIAQLAARLEAGTLTAVALTAAYLDRIERFDRAGPRINSVIEVNPDALDVAAALDEERGRTGGRGALHGIPVLLKDNIATSDRMETTAGSLALVGHRPRRAAAIVARLEGAGAVVLGKTNLSEWANIRSTRSTSGWSARGGLTRNPYALDRNTSGSSSGSAAAATAGFCAAAVGTETDGSIVSPASVNGLVGIKPTVGLVSSDGIVPISSSQDTAGPMARTVADAAALLTVLAGPDPRAPAPADAPALDYTHHLDDGRLAGVRLGVVDDHRVRHPGVGVIFDAAVELLERHGAVIVENVTVGRGGSRFDSLGEAELTVLLHELRVGMAEWLAEFVPRSGLASLDDIVEWNRRHADVEMPWFGQELFERALVATTEDEYATARATCLRLARDEGIDAALDERDLDALVAPTSGPAWLTDPINGDHHTDGWTTPAAVAGYPHVTVPMGTLPLGVDPGLPVGLSFVGRAWSEPLLIGLAHCFERHSTARRRPTFAPSAIVP